MNGNIPRMDYRQYRAARRSLRTELCDEEIFVTAVCPGPVETEFFEIAGQKEKNQRKAAVMARPEAVVKQALLDAREGKELSVYGTAMKDVYKRQPII